MVAQHALAAAAGAEILAAGGNAVDAAVATAFALGVVEPWMSGIGGSGYLIFGAAEGKVEIVDFSLCAARALDPSRYPLTGGTSSALFGWPSVVEDRNVRGYESICVPGSVDGLGLALERFGRKSLAEVMGPALRLVEEGLPVDWHTTLAIAIAARDLALYPTTREIYLPDGQPPVPNDEGRTATLRLGNLAATYRRLAAAGRRDFYEGALAADLAADLAAGGSAISAADLAGYQARIAEPLALDYRGVRLHGATALTGTPTFFEAMAELDKRIPSAPMAMPWSHTFLVYAEAIRRAFKNRLETMGAGGQSNTTHISVVDRDGNMVALTNTLLSRFGSKVVLPRTGVAMNNGMMWFDPVPNRPNSIAPGKRPLANMCPVVATRDGKPWAALGACGGRRIIPAIVQLVSFLVDFDMSLEKAFSTPRIDATGETVQCDSRLPEDVVAALAERMPVELVEARVQPSLFAVPSAVMRAPGSRHNSGMAHIHSPAAAAVAEPD